MQIPITCTECGTGGGGAATDLPLVACDGTEGEESLQVHVCNTDPIPVSIEAADVTVNVDVGPSVEVSNDAGNPVPVSGTVTATIADTKLEDDPHVSGASGSFVLGVRNDAATSFTTTDGDYSPIATDAAGRVGISDLGGSITVDGPLTDAQLRAAPVPVSGTVTITDGGGPVTVDGTVAISNASIEISNDVGNPIPVSGTVTITDGAGPVTVDGTVAISGTVTTADNKVEDAAHASGDTGSFVLGVRNDSAAAFTTTNGDYSPIATDSAGRVGISDLGGSITVDGTVSATSVATALTHGQNSDIDSGAEEQIVVASNPATQGVLVKALSANTGIIYVGITGVTSANGFPLEPGDSVSLPVDNANKVYARSSVDNQALAWVAT